MRTAFAVARFATTLILLGFAQARGADWPQFLGPHRNGISAETGLLEAFPAGGPKEVWRAKGGVGMSGLAVSGGRVITMLQADSKQLLAAWDSATGSPVWQTPLAPAYDNSQGAGPRSTPSIAGERVFTMTGEGILAAASLADGKLLWSKEVTKELKGSPAEYGTACSPLVVGDHVIVNIGAPGASVVAFDAATGNLVWKAGDDAIGYSSPVLLKLAGREQVVSLMGTAALGIAPDTGKVLWRYPFVTDFNCNTASPVAVGDGVLISAGEMHGSALLSLKPRGEEFDVVETWTSLGGDSELRAEWQTPIVSGSQIYGFDNLGGAGPITHLACIDATTGKRIWYKARFGKGNMIAADGKFWVATLAGELILLRENAAQFEELGRANVGIGTRQAPTLVDGRLYLRDDENIVCFDVRK